MRIDSHQHFWEFNPQRDVWITDDMAVLRRDFLPADLQPLLKTNSFDGCVAVQADQSEEETRFLLDHAARYEFISGVVGWVDLCADHIVPESKGGITALENLQTRCRSCNSKKGAKK